MDAQTVPNEHLRFLVFSGSLRKESLNTRLAKLAALAVEKNGGEVDFADIGEFDCPSYNQDVEMKGTFPNGANEFHARLLKNDAFIISSPEYNGSMPGFLKNMIDWASRSHVCISLNGRGQSCIMDVKDAF